MSAYTTNDTICDEHALWSCSDCWVREVDLDTMGTATSFIDLVDLDAVGPLALWSSLADLPADPFPRAQAARAA